MTRNSPPTIEHLPGIRSRFVKSSRLETYLLETESDGEPVLFLHGNAASSTFWEEVMAGLPHGFRGIAPDLRGYGLTDRTALIDAQRGVGEWVDDIHALLEVLKIGAFHLAGHSMGGMIGWGVLADARFEDRIQSATLVAPGPPCGFGGLHGAIGLPNNPDFSGSGAGLVPQPFIELIARGERNVTDAFFSPRAVMNRVFWKPPFRPVREEAFLSALLQVHLGDKQFPGDAISSPYWPGFAPGRHGPINAMSGRYNRDVPQRLLERKNKPPLLVVLGAEDPVISDESASDPAVLGKSGVLPGWPGMVEFPPQSFRAQLKETVSRYRANAGSVDWIVFHNCGHSPYLEQAGEFRRVFHEFLKTRVGEDYAQPGNRSGEFYTGDF